MKIKVKLPDGYGLSLIFDAELASTVATLLPAAKIYKEDGYGSSATIGEAKDVHLGMEFVQDDMLEPIDPKLAAALKQAEDANTARWKAEGEKKKAEDALAVLKAATTCTRAPAPDEENTDVE